MKKPGMSEVISKFPRLGVLINALGTLLLRNDDFDHLMSELVGTLASKINGCHFCYNVHRWTCIFILSKRSPTFEINLLERIVDDYLEFGEPNDLLPKDSLQLFYVTHKVMNNERINERVTEKYSHFINVASGFKLFNLLVEAYGGPASSEIMKDIGKHLAEKGYEIPSS